MPILRAGVFLMVFSMITECLSSETSTSSMRPLRVAVFCSADDKINNDFKVMAYTLGQNLALKGAHLITGGSKTGLMKEVVDGYMSKGDSKNLKGVLPQALKNFKVEHPSIPNDQLMWVETMHKRLSSFHQMSDVVIVLPGGFGTLHELMDFLVHNQFGLQKHGIIILNINDFWSPLLRQFDDMVSKKALDPKHLSLLRPVKTVDECMLALFSEKERSNHQGLEARFWESK